MWALPEIVVLMPIIWKWVKNMMAIFRTALNRESSALLKMSDMVVTVSPQKPISQIINQKSIDQLVNRSIFVDMKEKPERSY